MPRMFQTPCVNRDAMREAQDRFTLLHGGLFCPSLPLASCGRCTRLMAAAKLIDEDCRKYGCGPEVGCVYDPAMTNERPGTGEDDIRFPERDNEINPPRVPQPQPAPGK